MGEVLRCRWPVLDEFSGATTALLGLVLCLLAEVGESGGDSDGAN